MYINHALSWFCRFTGLSTGGISLAQRYTLVFSIHFSFQIGMAAQAEIWIYCQEKRVELGLMRAVAGGAFAGYHGTMLAFYLFYFFTRIRGVA